MNLSYFCLFQWNVKRIKEISPNFCTNNIFLINWMMFDPQGKYIYMELLSYKPNNFLRDVAIKGDEGEEEMKSNGAISGE